MMLTYRLNSKSRRRTFLVKSFTLYEENIQWFKTILLLTTAPSNENQCNEETNDEITNNQKKVVVVNSGLNISMVIVISSLIMSLVSSANLFLFSALESFSECFLVPMH